MCYACARRRRAQSSAGCVSLLRRTRYLTAANREDRIDADRYRYMLLCECTSASEGCECTSTSEEYVPKRVVPPERQQNLEVFCPSMGHACIRLQIGLKAHASSRRRISQQQTEEADRDTRCVPVWHLVRTSTWYQVAVAVFFGEHSKKHSQKKGRPPNCA